MSKNYDHEFGYESLLADFKRYNKQTPKGVTLARKGRNIYLQFKTTNKARAQYACDCSFTLDGMVEALSKAHKVADKLKSCDSETEFWQWYDFSIKESVNLKNDQLTFQEAINIVEKDFWSRLSRTKRTRDKSNPSDQSSWSDTYGCFYKHLPQDKRLNFPDILSAIDKYDKGTRHRKYIISVMKKLARLNKRIDIIDALEELDSVQTKFQDLQSITVKSFLDWRDKTLNAKACLDARINLDERKAWLWVFSMQIVYGLRIGETIAIQNLYEPFKTKDGVLIPALNDLSNTTNLIYVGDKTILGTTTKTSARIARPILPPKHLDLIELLKIKDPRIRASRPNTKSYGGIRKFWASAARKVLIRYNAPTTSTHAFRHLANLNGMQAGIPQEVRAQSLGHSIAMNETVYKKRQGTQTTIDLLLHSNVQALDFVTALNEAKVLVKDNRIDKEGCALLLAKIYQKDSSEIIKLL